MKCHVCLAQSTAVTQKTPDFSTGCCLDVSGDVDHEAELDRVVQSLVEGRCVFIRQVRNCFKEHFLLSDPSGHRNRQECLEGLSWIPWRAVPGLMLSH